MRLWVETAIQSMAGAWGGPVSETIRSHAVRTFQTEERFWAILVDWPQAGAKGVATAGQIADQAGSLLQQAAPPDTLAEALLASLPRGEHVPVAVLTVLDGGQAHLVEIDAPPLFFTRRGRLVLLPVVEEEVSGRLLRRCRFTVQEGDHLAIVSEGYIRARGWDRRWGWRDIALSVRRLTDTGGDAESLLGALVRMYHRLAQGETQREVTVIAMHVRPLRSATVWSGPPADPAQDRAAVERLLAEEGTRVICGGTTAEIAARVLGLELGLEPRPAGGWGEVPPTFRLAGVDLVTEGVVTLRQARERIAGVRRAGDLPRSDEGATRLARVLLTADVIRFVIGRAVNPAQTDGAISWRQSVVEELVANLRAGGKIVSIETVGESIRTD